MRTARQDDDVLLVLNGPKPARRGRPERCRPAVGEGAHEAGRTMIPVLAVEPAGDSPRVDAGP